jgi:hypothetical protein
VEYTGFDVYTPSEWVLRTVGRVFSGSREFHWTCFGYDPRCGFWMRAIQDSAREVITNVSEWAIGRTYHEVFVMPADWIVLDSIHTLGRLPEHADVKVTDLFGDPSDVQHVIVRLRTIGWLGKDDKCTLLGNAILENYRAVYGDRKAA